MHRFQTYEYDVVIVGAGGAGLRAAIESSRCGAKTALVCKSLLGKAHTVMAEGGIAAALANVDSRDDWRVHFRDTMKGGSFLNQWKMVQIHAQEAPERVRELETWGAVFDRTKDGRILQRNFGGHTYPRLAHVGDRTGLEMIRTLQDRGVHQGIDVHMECTIRRILKDGQRVSGCFGYQRESGRFVVFRAPAVVIATGGIGRCWEISSNSWEYTADGHAMALWAGADLIDMEFVQFHPTGMVWPPSVRGTLITEGVRGEGGVLLNSLGKRFMFDYVPARYQGEFAETEEEADRWVRSVVAGERPEARQPPELLTRDVVARAIRNEIRQGRASPHGGVLLDIASRRSGEEIKKKLPSMYHQFKELADVNITAEPMEVGPTCHYMMGGVAFDPESQQSTVPGLFAAGEAAGGMHGANRLGGNSLSDLLVFGKRAGEHAARFASESSSRGQIDNDEVDCAAEESLKPFGEGGGENPYAVHEELRSVMQSLVGIVRAEDDLKLALDKFEKLRARAASVKVGGNIQYNPGWHLALDLKNMLDISEAVTRAALERTESRGAHTREDFPDSIPEWGDVNAIVRQTDSGMGVSREPLSKMPDDLQQLLRANDMAEEALLSIYRGDKNVGEMVDYAIPVEPGMVVLDAVHAIQATSAPDLAVRWNCKAGKCGSCGGEVNGKPRLMCMDRLDNYPAGEPISVRPMKSFPVLKDLVCDVSWNYRVNKKIPSFKMRSGEDEPRFSQEEADRVQEFRKCIECFLCQNVCHVLREHDQQESFGGPRFFVRVAGLEMHPLDEGNRLGLLKDELGIGLCNITKCCTEVCPESIKITDNAIIPLKERVVDEFYDPLKRLFRIIFPAK